MRKGILAAWLVLPIGAWAYHEGPGQDRLALDRVDALLDEARVFAGEGTWGAAASKYEAALQGLPAGRVAERRSIRLEWNKARMQASQLPAARADLEELVAELQADAGADPEVLGGARAALASAHYYMTWLMRLEGQPREVWEPEVEAARQIYRLLAEDARGRGDEAVAARHAEDLESAIRLERMELQDLQGLPLPSQ